MDKITHLADIEKDLNNFTAERRSHALDLLAQRIDQGDLQVKPEQDQVNQHCHTFFSFNAYGFSPSGLAWLAKREGYRALGIVDFDVLDGVDEFLRGCALLEVRGSAGIETRVFIPEYSERELNSPGEPGVAYYMGIGFTSGQAPEPVQSILGELRQRAAQRNIDMVRRLNEYLSPVTIDYTQDVFPLTPAHNPTERHLLAAYILEASRQPDPAQYWAERLKMPQDQVATLMKDGPAFQNQVRTKLMKKGGVGYVQPGPQSFPTLEKVNALIVACGAIPCAAWLDGTSAGEMDIEKLLDLLIRKGVAALNIIPDRNWNIADPEKRKVKVQNLHHVARLAEKLNLPLNIGTEMNSHGQKWVDDLDVPELAPLKKQFLDGADFIYGHTVLQAACGLGYQSGWAKSHLPTRAERNTFFTQAGRVIPPGIRGKQTLTGLDENNTPADILTKVASI